MPKGLGENTVVMLLSLLDQDIDTCTLGEGLREVEERRDEGGEGRGREWGRWMCRRGKSEGVRGREQIHMFIIIQPHIYTVPYHGLMECQEKYLHENHTSPSQLQ